MTDDFGFPATGVAVADTDIPESAAFEDSDFQFDEPEGGGKFAPRILPGPVKARIEIVEVREKDNSTTNPSVHRLANGKVPLIIYTAHVPVGGTGLATTRLVRPEKDGAATELAVRFNEASGFKSKAMAEKKVSSDLERLYTAMGLAAEFGAPKSVDQMVQMIRGAGSNRTIDAKIGWSAAIKLGDRNYEIYSTDPDTKRGEKGWPRGADGKLAIEITFSNGETKTARENVVAIYPPKAAKKS